MGTKICTGSVTRGAYGPEPLNQSARIGMGVRFLVSEFAAKRLTSATARIAA